MSTANYDDLFEPDSPSTQVGAEPELDMAYDADDETFVSDNASSNHEADITDDMRARWRPNHLTWAGAYELVYGIAPTENELDPERPSWEMLNDDADMVAAMSAHNPYQTDFDQLPAEQQVWMLRALPADILEMHGADLTRRNEAQPQAAIRPLDRPIFDADMMRAIEWVFNVHDQMPFHDLSPEARSWAIEYYPLWLANRGVDLSTGRQVQRRNERVHDWLYGVEQIQHDEPHEQYQHDEPDEQDWVAAALEADADLAEPQSQNDADHSNAAQAITDPYLPDYETELEHAAVVAPATAPPANPAQAGRWDLTMYLSLQPVILGTMPFHDLTEEVRAWAIEVLPNDLLFYLQELAPANIQPAAAAPPIPATGNSVEETIRIAEEAIDMMMAQNRAEDAAGAHAQAFEGNAALPPSPRLRPQPDFVHDRQLNIIAPDWESDDDEEDDHDEAQFFAPGFVPGMFDGQPEPDSGDTGDESTEHELTTWPVGFPNPVQVRHVDEHDSSTCDICYEPLAGKFVPVLPCGHSFDGACLAHWFEDGNSTCPMCRRNYGT